MRTTVAISIALLLAMSPAPAAEPTADQPPATGEAPADPKLLVALERTKKKAASIQMAFGKAIGKAIDRVQKSDLHVDEKEFRLKAMRDDLILYRESGKLPICNELLPETIEYVRSMKPVYDSIEKLRIQRANAALNAADTEVWKQHAAFEGRIRAIFRGREFFKVGAVWNGSRNGADRAATWKLTITEVAENGNAFRGQMVENGFQTYEVTGLIEGYVISFQSTLVVRGGMKKKHTASFQARGYLLSDRIVGQAATLTFKGEKYESLFSLLHQAANKGGRIAKAPQ